MGLDMYAFRRKGAVSAAVDFDALDTDEKIAYWRKHPDLHGWMEDLYREKGGTDDQFNCVNVELTAADIDRLEQCVKNRELPETSGFFFGASCPEDIEDDLAFISAACEAIAAGDAVYYTSWW